MKYMGGGRLFKQRLEKAFSGKMNLDSCRDGELQAGGIVCAEALKQQFFFFFENPKKSNVEGTQKSGGKWNEKVVEVGAGFQKGHRFYREGSPTNKLTSGSRNKSEQGQKKKKKMRNETKASWGIQPISTYFLLRPRYCMRIRNFIMPYCQERGFLEDTDQQGAQKRTLYVCGKEDAPMRSNSHHT